jgi:FixJ family two-component response regulator
VWRGHSCPRFCFVESKQLSIMPELRSMIFVVDDDASVREALGNLLESVGFEAQLFSSTESFRSSSRPDVPSCLLLDLQLPGTNGLEFQQALQRANIFIPIIFITAHGDVPSASRALKAGAVEFLTKPVQKDELLAAIRQGLNSDRIRRAEEAEIASVKVRFDELTSREREVFELVATGLTNKDVAGRLGISEVTTKMHRGQVMRKMGASSVVDLVRMSDRLKSKH